ncbi:MAG: Uma2 family endonuclease [Pseudomonadota bacterium]
MAYPKRSDELVTVDEYLAGEASSAVRHEFVDGLIYAMAGATEAHIVIAANLTAALTVRAPDASRVFPSDMKVEFRNDEVSRFYYPDVVVACGEHDNARDRRSDPRLIIEVLSPSTERADRSEKFEIYKQLETMGEYVLVDQVRKQVEVFRRANNWQREVYLPDQAIQLESVGVKLTFDEVYRRVDLDQAANDSRAEAEQNVR